MVRKWNDKIFNLNKAEFEGLALELFRFQYDQNPVYRDFTDSLAVAPPSVNSLSAIPFLPIRAFQAYRVVTGAFEAATVFESSGTTGGGRSHHYVRDLYRYEQSFQTCFRLMYGSPREYCILGLLPSYLERKNSSLVYMVDKLILEGHHPQSGFYLNEFEKLLRLLKELAQSGTKVILVGVTFALLDFAAFAAQRGFPEGMELIVIETGGMKGRQTEIVREEVHTVIRNAFHLGSVHSEYGMTELLSQAYARKDGIFYSPPWMKVLLREEDDPLHVFSGSKGTMTGAINIIDLANVDSCCFLATDDVGKLYADDGFEVLGRLDGSDLRGCSLLTI